MKTLFAAMIAAFLSCSCVFEEPFEPTAKLPVDDSLTGLWEEVLDDAGRVPNRLLVLKHSKNEYVVQYPMGPKAMFFRAYAVELEGSRFMQIQLTGTAEGPVKAADRKYHLLRVEGGSEALSMQVIRPEALGKNLKGTQALREAFAVHRDDAGLFDDPMRFRRVRK
jgi:hypothetical protein